MNRSRILKKVIWGVTATTVAYYTPLLHHTVLLPVYKHLTVRRVLSTELPVAQRLQELLQEVMEDLKLPKDIRARIQLFSNFNFDMFHAGTLSSKYGAIIGIPINFEHTHISTVDKEEIMIDGDIVDWTKEDANNFINATVISEKAKKFALAREILRLKNDEPHIRSYSLAAVVMSLYTSYNIASYKLNLPEAKPLYRRLILSFTILFGIGCWIAVKDHYSYKYDIENDSELSKLGPSYIEGGHEYYNKLVKRNIASRTLLGQYGTTIFAPNGNEYYYFKMNNVPLSHRKTFFDSKLADIQQLA